MKPEEKLVTDIFDEEQCLREATLQSGLRAMRQRNRQRTLVRTGGAALIAGMLALVGRQWWHQDSSSMVATHTPRPIVSPAPHVIAGTEVEIIDDQQLLDLFTNRPVAIVGAGENRRLLLLDETNRSVLQ